MLLRTTLDLIPEIGVRNGAEIIQQRIAHIQFGNGNANDISGLVNDGAAAIPALQRRIDLHLKLPTPVSELMMPFVTLTVELIPMPNG